MIIVMGNGFFWCLLMVSCEQVVSGIALPSGSDKLYTGSKDESVRVWDCQSAQVTSRFWATPIFSSSTQLRQVSICFSIFM